MSQSLPPQLEGQVSAPNPLELFWEQHKKPILTVAFLVVGLVAAYYLKQYYDSVKRNEAASLFLERTGLDRLIDTTEIRRREQFTALDSDLAQVSLSDLDTYIADVAKGTAYEPWAIWVAANAQLVQGNPDAAEARLKQLKSAFPDHVLCAESKYPPQVRSPVEEKKDKKNKKKRKPNPKDEPKLKPAVAGSPVDRLLQAIQDNDKFRKEHPNLFEAPQPDGEKVEILLKNTKLVIQFYKDAAPEHVKHFLELVKEGFYNGQKVYKIQRDPGDSRREREPQLLHFGLAKTKETDSVAEWDKAAAEPSKTLLDFPKAERQKKLSFFPGMLAVENEKDGKTSGERLFLNANDCASSLDGEFVILGKVIEGPLEELSKLTEHFSSGDEERVGVGKPADPIEISITLKK